jgi:LysM repeat protein
MIKPNNLRRWLNLVVTTALVVAVTGFAPIAWAHVGVLQQQQEDDPAVDTYTVQPGDTMWGIALRHGVPLTTLIDANPHIVNPRVIFPGQVINIPDPAEPIPITGPGQYIVQPGDTMWEIAIRHGVSLRTLIAANPHIVNPRVIFSGQVVNIPDPDEEIPITGPEEEIYIVQPGDTMFRIAVQHGTTVADLAQRNPHIVNPNLIFPGQRIVVPEVEEAPPPEVTPPDEVIFQDDFSVVGLWFTRLDPNFHIRYEAGGYRISNNFLNSYVNSVRSFPHADIHVEVDAARIAGPETGYYGVVCRWQDVDNYYALALGSDGFHAIVRVVNGQIQFLATGTEHEAIQTGEGATNRIGGSCLGNTLTLFANDQPLLQIQDDTFTSGLVGLTVFTRTSPGVDVHFDNFALVRP